MEMKVVISIGLVILGAATSVLAEAGLRRLIQALFKWNDIYFYGKNFHLFASPYYYLSFGLGLLTIWFSWDDQKAKQKAIDLLLTLIVFFMGIGFISWLVSTKLIVECTACDDGTRGVHYNDINYDAIVVVSIFLSMISSGMRLIRRAMAAITQQ